jgi:ribosomal protein L31
MSKERYDEVIDIAYENFRVKVKDEYFPVYKTKEKFIDTVKNYPEFSKKWGLKIEERELSLEERLIIADKFNPLIREDCLTKTHHPDETDELKLQYRHEWLDSLGPNVVPQRKVITITYNNEIVKYYES